MNGVVDENFDSNPAIGRIPSVVTHGRISLFGEAVDVMSYHERRRYGKVEPLSIPWFMNVRL